MSLKNSMKKGDIAILICVFLMAGITFIFAVNQAEGERVLINVDGELTSCSLQKNQRIVLKKNDNHYNTIVIENGEVFMENASCPDQICVHHKKISKNGETIICLPNEVYLEVVSSNDNEIDN